MKSTFASPGSATSGLQGYDLEGSDKKTKHGKASKSEAGYVDDSPTRQCETCTMFMAPDACTAVRGKISPDGHCNYYEMSGARKTAPLRAAGIALISRENGKVLFLRRAEDGDDHPGEWNFPGGGINDGETEEQAAIRELLEETGITLEDDGSRRRVGKTLNNEIEYTTFTQKVDQEFEPRLNGEHSAARWVSLDFPPEPLHPWVRAALPLVKSAAIDLTLKAAGAAPDQETKTMENLALFVPVLKVDAVNHIVYGTAVAEVADRANEIFDYKSSKPEFEKWSEDFEKTTEGKSKGNVRAMHGKVAAGKLTDIGFDDERKAIDVAAKIVDADEWEKVVQGVYTGFSIGGKYLKRWQDGDLKRYTASPSEISLVDMPCVPTATFSLIKADGSEEIRKFVSVEKTEEVVAEVEKTEESETVKVEDIAKESQVWVHPRLAGKQFAKKLDLRKALAELDAEEAAAKTAADVMSDEKKPEAEVEKTEEVIVEAVEKTDEVVEEVEATEIEAEKAVEIEAVETDEAAKTVEAEKAAAAAEVEKRKFDEAKRKKDAKNGDAESDGSYPIENKTDLENAIRAYGRSKNKAKTKRHIMARARSLGLSSMLPADWKKMVDGDLQKDASLYGMSDLMGMLACVECLEDRAESSSYGFGVDLPKDVTDRFGLALVNLGDVVADVLDVVLASIREEERDEAVNRAAAAAGLLKQDTATAEEEITEKVEDGEMEKTADTEATAKKIEELEIQNAAAKVAFEKVLASVKEEVAKHKAETDAEVKKIRSEKDELHKQVMAIRHQPMTAHGMNLRVVEKSIDTGGAEKAEDVSNDDLRQRGLDAQMARIAGRR
jgi:8-oxo-dGTP pyrophosphatase MutT (NUDIX family)